MGRTELRSGRGDGGLEIFLQRTGKLGISRPRVPESGIRYPREYGSRQAGKHDDGGTEGSGIPEGKDPGGLRIIAQVSMNLGVKMVPHGPVGGARLQSCRQE